MRGGGLVSNTIMLGARCAALRSAHGRFAARSIATQVPQAPFDVLFCGTDAFAHRILARFLERKDLYQHIQVLTPRDAPHAWGGKRMRVSPVKQLAEAHKLPIDHVPSAGMDAYTLPDALQTSSAPLLLTVSFGHMIPAALLERFGSPSQTLNVHPSLLPLLRGAAPIQWALARQLEHTGVSVQQLAPKRFDTGKILGQVALPIPMGSTYSTLAPMLADVGADLLVDVVAHLPQRDADAQVQEEARASRAPKLTKAQADVRWDAWGADTVDARIRAFESQMPLTTTLVPAKPAFPQVPVTLRVGVSLRRTAHCALADCDTKAAALLHGQPAGTAVYSPPLRAVVVRCASEQDVFLLSTLQTQGKPTRDADTWWRGFHDRSDEQGRIRFVSIHS